MGLAKIHLPLRKVPSLFSLETISLAEEGVVGLCLRKWGWLVTGKQKITWRETLECHGRDDH